MRIAHVTDFYLPRLGGIEMHVSDLADRQARAGHDVRVLTSSPGPDDGIAVRLTGGFRRPHALHPLAARAGTRAVRADGYDVVHAHLGVGSPLAFFAARAAARAGVPTVVTVHSMWVGVQPIMAALDAWGRWTQLPIVWTAVSEAAAAPVRRLLPAGRRVLVVPNGIDQHEWRSPTRKTRTDEVVLAAVMRLAARKRPLALLGMVRDAQVRLGPDVRLRLVIAGDGPLWGTLQRKVRQHGLTGTVTLRGRLDRAQVHHLLGQADLFVAPANLESFGIAALEARCTGLPVVAKACGGVREFVRHEREGLLCGSDDEMVQAIVRLARDVGLRARITRHNQTSDCEVSWSSVLERTEAAYLDARRAQPVRAVPTASLPDLGHTCTRVLDEPTSGEALVGADGDLGGMPDHATIVGCGVGPCEARRSSAGAA